MHVRVRIHPGSGYPTLFVTYMYIVICELDSWTLCCSISYNACTFVAGEPPSASVVGPQLGLSSIVEAPSRLLRVADKGLGCTAGCKTQSAQKGASGVLLLACQVPNAASWPVVGSRSDGTWLLQVVKWANNSPV